MTFRTSVFDGAAHYGNKTTGDSDGRPRQATFHGLRRNLSRGEPRRPISAGTEEGSAGKVGALLGVLLIGATTAVAATGISSRSPWRGEYAVPMQPMPPFIAKLPGTVGFQEALY